MNQEFERAARGLGGVPQTSLGFFAGTIREVLGIPEQLKLRFRISFSYPDEAAPSNWMRMGRMSIEDRGTFHS